VEETSLKKERSLYEQIELHVLTHAPCYQKDIIRCFEGEYSKHYIEQTCYKLWEDARICRKKVGVTYELWGTD